MAVLGPWEKVRMRELARKVIHRLSRLKASGLFAECSYDSVWAEYSHHVQNGDFDGFSDILDDLAAETCRAVADTVPAHEMHLFDQLAQVCGDEAGMTGHDYLVQELKDLVATKAAIRNLNRYADDYRWYDNL